MSVISNLITQIRTAIYGEEVREAIASGIEQCYTDVSSGSTLANTAANNANEKATLANTAASNANAAASNANDKAAAAQDAINTLDQTVDTIVDQNVDTIVAVQQTQPSAPHNKIWIQPQSDEYQVPTWEEFTDLQSAIDYLASGDDMDVKTIYTYVAGRGNGTGANTYIHLTDTWTTDYARNLVLYFDTTKYVVTIYAFGITSGTYLTPVQGISTSPIDFAHISGLAFDNYASVGVEIKKTDASILSDADKADIARTTYSIEMVETQVGKNKTDINDIKTKIGNTPMGTTAETITGAIAEHESGLSSVESTIGNTPMGTTAATITGAIAEISSTVGVLETTTERIEDTTVELVKPVNKYNPEGNGYYLKGGGYHESVNHKWMHLNVEEGDVVRLYQWGASGGVTKYRLSANMFICAYSGDTVVSDAGFSTGQDVYTVPETIDKIIISINVAIVTKALVTVNLDTPPEVETPYTEPYYDQRTDKTLSNANVAADAKAVGDKFANQKKAGVDIILPGTVYAYKNGEINLYHKNVIDCDNIDNYGIVWGMQESTTYSRAYNECLRVTPTADTSATGCVLRIIDRKTQETLKQQNFIFRARTSPASALKVMFIGDSLTEFGYYPAEIIKNLSSGNVASIGTRPKTITVDGESVTFNHEGRSGWSAVEYVTESAQGSVVNAFWNPSTGKFDFFYYMDQNGFDGVDIVVIELGTNDASGLTGMNLNDVIDAYIQMVTSIQKYATDNSKTVKIIISLTTPSAERDGWANTNGRTGTPDRFDYYQKLIVKTLISTFESMQGVWLASSYANLDTAHDFPAEDVAVSARNPLVVSRQTDNVHPSVYGYKKIADAVWAAIANAVAAS